jgi:hypothetical protein
MKNVKLTDVLVRLNIIKKNLKKAILAGKKIGGRCLEPDEWLLVQTLFGKEEIKEALLREGEEKELYKEAQKCFIAFLKNANDIIYLSYFAEAFDIPIDLMSLSKIVSYHSHHLTKNSAVNINGAASYVMLHQQFFTNKNEDHWKLVSKWLEMAKIAAIGEGQIRQILLWSDLSGRKPSSEEIKKILSICAGHYADKEGLIPKEDLNEYERLLNFLPETEAQIYKEFVFE